MYDSWLEHRAIAMGMAWACLVGNENLESFIGEAEAAVELAEASLLVVLSLPLTDEYAEAGEDIRPWYWHSDSCWFG